MENKAENLNRLRDVRCFLLDMDGTFYLGEQIIPGSMEFLDCLSETGRDFLFLTNNSSRSIAHYVQKLSRLGLETDENHVLSSGTAASLYLKREFPGKRIFLLGNESLRQEIESHGIQIDNEHPDLVLIGFDTTLNYQKMTAVCDYVRSGLPYIATHPDFNCPTETGFIPDIGAIIAFIEASANRRPDVIIGKPYGEIINCVLEKTGLRKEQLAMVGDRLYTDIRTGVDHGILSILVMSGETDEAALSSSAIQPDLCFDCLGDIIPYLK